MDKQERLDKSYLEIAKVWAKNSKAERRKVGVLIVNNGQIISDGYNGMPSGMNNTCEDENGLTKWEVLHAELNAILKCAKNNNSTKGATIYTTLSPCKHCSLMIYQSGIERIVYIEKYKDIDGLNFLKKRGLQIKQYSNI